MNIIASLAVIVLASYILAAIAIRLRIPSEVALIFGGLIIGFPQIRNIIIEPNSRVVFLLGDIALFCLMFIAGLEISWSALYREKRDSIFVALFASFIPFILGFLASIAMGLSVIVSLIIGICMSITSEATKARVLMELGKLKTRVGAAMMGAGIFDDIIGLSGFMIITYVFKATYLKEDMMLAGVILVFFLGILTQQNIGRHHPVIKSFEKSILVLLVPFFFISLGMHFDIFSLFVNPYLLLVIIIVAIAGKMLGTLMTKHFVKFKWSQLRLIGWAMNSRGAIELALAVIALRSGLIPVEVYSSLVIMALITTLMFPVLITRIIRRHPRIMN